MTWSPDDDTLSKIRSAPSVPYDGGGLWDTTACATSPTARAAALSTLLRQTFPAITAVQILHCQSMMVNGHRELTLHAAGRALDVFVPMSAGTAVASWCVQKAPDFGIQLVIWDQMVWQGSRTRSTRFLPYTGGNPHTDHVHVEVNNRALPGSPAAPPPMARTPAPTSIETVPTPVMSVDVPPAPAPELASLQVASAPAGQWTFPGDGSTWVDTRFDMLVRCLTDLGLPIEVALPVGWAMLGQLAVEVGPFGAQSEWDYNPGNLICSGTPTPGSPGWQGDCHQLPGNPHTFRSYPSLHAGVWDYVALHVGQQDASGAWQGRYHDAFTYLLQHPSDGAGWFAQVLAAGYVDPSDGEALASILHVYRAVLADLSARRGA